MKINLKIIIIVKIIFFLIIFSDNVNAQQLCNDAYIINTLPFNAINVNTDFADTDTTIKYCGNSMNHGKDTVFSYTPTNNEYIDIELSNPIISNDALVCLYLIDACIDEAHNCIGIATGGNFIIENELLTANHTYYILITNSLWGTDNFIFDLEVRNHYDFDVGIIEVNEPRSNCELGSNHEVSFDIKNFGNNPAYNFSFKAIVNGVETIYNYTDTLQPGEIKINFPFDYFDLSQNPQNTITGIIQYANDENANNDTIIVVTNNLGWENVFPYNEDFETQPYSWVTEWNYVSNHYSSFQFGQPNASIINSAFSGTNCAVTDLTSNTYPYEKSVLVGPCFDFTNLTIPILEFSMWRSLDSTASVYIEYNATETDNWTRLGDSNSGENWYDPIYGQVNDTWISNTQGWITSKIRLNFLAHEPKVRFRFIYDNHTFNTPEGVAIDNIKIYEAPNHDIGVTSIINPVSKCNINNDSITVVISNFSPDSAHSNFVIKALIDNTYELIDTVAQTVQANDSLIYTFNNTYNFNENKEYNLKATTYLINEDDTTNDSDSAIFFNYNNNSLPYFNDFETNNGTWFSTGINTSWEYGTPTDSVISNAASGTKIWATNLSGYHNKPEESYLTSSCFDLSQIENPIIKFNANYDLYLDDGVTSSYVQLQYSSDNGANWTSLGTANNNWYDAGFSWVGKSENWVQKLYNISDLTSLEDIQLRFKLFALEEKTGFAFDDFTICNAPLAGFTYSASGRDVFINDTSNYGTSYKWYINDTLVSSEQNPILTVLEDTTHITQVVINDCFSDTITHTIFTSSIYKLGNGNIKIYPNPTNNNIYIENNKYNISSIEIINSLGKTELLTLTRDKQKIYKIDISNLYNGIYIIKIKTNSAIFIEKIIKK